MTTTDPLAAHIQKLAHRYTQETPPHHRTTEHQTQWIADILRNEILPNLGYHQISPPSGNTTTPSITPNIEYAIGAPGIAPYTPISGNLDHAKELLTRSTPGTKIAHRYIGPWQPHE